MDFAQLVSLLTWVSPFVLLTGIIIGFCYCSVLTVKNRYLLVYLGFCLSIDLLSRAVGKWFENNLLLLIVYSLLELCFFYVFYRVCYFGRKSWKHLLLVIAASIYMIVEIFLLNKIAATAFQSYARTISSFLILIMVIEYLFEVLYRKSPQVTSVVQQFIFIFYFTINLIFFLPINFLINVTSDMKYYFWAGNLVVTIVFYTLIVSKIWKNGFKQKRLQRGLL